jgi:hypothetical protein
MCNSNIYVLCMLQQKYNTTAQCATGANLKHLTGIDCECAIQISTAHTQFKNLLRMRNLNIFCICTFKVMYLLRMRKNIIGILCFTYLPLNCINRYVSIDTIHEPSGIYSIVHNVWQILKYMYIVVYNMTHATNHLLPGSHALDVLRPEFKCT